MGKANITKGQIKAIWAIAKRIGLSEDELYDIVESFTGERSLHSLSRSQANDLIDWLKLAQKGQLDKWRGGGLATERQKWLIKQLARRVFSGGAGWRRRLRAFLEKRFRVSDVEWLEREEASKVINALKYMEKRSCGKKSAMRS